MRAPDRRLAGYGYQTAARRRGSVALQKGLMRSLAGFFRRLYLLARRGMSNGGEMKVITVRGRIEVVDGVGLQANQPMTARSKATRIVLAEVMQAMDSVFDRADVELWNCRPEFRVKDGNVIEWEHWITVDEKGGDA